jgi:hypothetical protein
MGKRGDGYVLVTVTAEGCGACKAFKGAWGDTKQKLQAQCPGLTVVDTDTADTRVHQPYVGAPFTGRLASLSNRRAWYPLVLLLTQADWAAAARGGGVDLARAAVYQGRYDGYTGKLEHTGGNGQSLASFVIANVPYAG